MITMDRLDIFRRSCSRILWLGVTGCAGGATATPSEATSNTGAETSTAVGTGTTPTNVGSSSGSLPAKPPATPGVPTSTTPSTLPAETDSAPYPGATSELDPPSSTVVGGSNSTMPSDATVPSDTTETSAASGSTNSDTSLPPNVLPPTFLLGADISSIPEALDAGAVFVDTDGQTKPLLTLLKNHGFNAIRLRTFVNPDAPYGYARGTGGSCVKAEPYNDTSHTAEFGAAVKAAGMQLLVDLHYSDTWADPGKQIIPEAWRDAASIDELADEVSRYTTNVLDELVAAGAKPDMVQVGNETTPGMLIHVPGNDTDCWGNNSSVRTGLNGQASNGNWDNLAKLFKAGADAVHAVDPNIKVVLHIENTDDLAGVRWWVDSAVSRGIDFDVLGLSAYTEFQGQPSVWENTLTTIADEFPGLEFIIAEYNPERTRANQIVHDLPGARGLGTFFWEPTQSGAWGDSMFTQSGNTYTARTPDFAEYDALRLELGL